MSRAPILTTRNNLRPSVLSVLQEKKKRINWKTNMIHSKGFSLSDVQQPTRKSAHKPVELLLGDVGPGEVECNWLSLYNASEGLRGHGAFNAQVDSRPKPLV